jgi:hypothetical protein
MVDLASDLICALDPVAFCKDRLGFTPDPWQARALSSTANSLALNCARQTGKSSTAGAKATHVAVYEPGSLVLLISPTLRQSRELFAKIMVFIKGLQPAEVLEEDNKSSCTLANNSRIVSLPGEPATARGFSAPRLIIEDEAAWVDDEMHVAIKPMLAVSRGQLWVMSTPFGQRGHFHDIWTNGGPSWERIKVAARECPRIDAAFLERERSQLGDWRFRQEYENQFVSTDDQLFGYDLIMSAFDDSVQPLFSPPPNYSFDGSVTQ